MNQFIFFDNLSEKLYSARTNNGTDRELVDAFLDMTRSPGGDRNAIPDFWGLSLCDVMATEVYYVSESLGLMDKLRKLILAIPHLTKPMRLNYEARLQEFIDGALSNVGMRSITLLAEEPIVVNSRLFNSVFVSLEFTGGYLIRLYFRFEVASWLHNRFLELSTSQYDTQLRLWFKNPFFRRGILAKAYLGNDRKRNDISNLDLCIYGDICEIIRKQFMPGIYLGQFNGIPLLHTYLIDERAKNPNGIIDDLSSGERTNFLELLSAPSNKYNRTSFYSPRQTAELVELRPRNGRALTSYAKLVTTESNIYHYLEILKIFSEKEAFWLQSSLIYDIERQYASSLLAMKIKRLRKERQEILKQEMLYQTLMASFKFNKKLHFGNPDGPLIGLALPVGTGKEIDYGRYGYGQIRQAMKLINEHLRPLIRRSEIVKEEAESAFQCWVQIVSIVLACLALIPVAQAVCKLVVDSWPQAPSAPLTRPRKWI